MAMELFGFDVTVETDSVRALDYFRAHPDDFDVVMTDMTMPHLAGPSFIQEVRKTRPEIPTIIFTGFSEAWMVEDAREAGVTCLITKPTDPKIIADKIRKILADKTD